MSAVVVVPLELGFDRDRLRAWAYTEQLLIEHGWPILAAPQPVGSPVDGRKWCKARAVADSLDTGYVGPQDVLVVHDADVLVDQAQLKRAVQLVEAGDVQWAIPHREVHRLSRRATDHLYDTEQLPEWPELERLPYVGIAGGGVVVLRRSVYDAIPLDPRFAGWGDEDGAWGMALTTLAGEPWRATTRLVHLWHPANRATRQVHNADPDAVALWRSYRGAVGRPSAMEKLVRRAATWGR